MASLTDENTRPLLDKAGTDLALHTSPSECKIAPWLKICTCSSIFHDGTWLALSPSPIWIADPPYGTLDSIFPEIKWCFDWKT
jgi:hypothetical protein